MKKLLFIAAISILSLSVNAAIKINKIEPANWYAGLKHSSLQLLIYGKDISKVSVSTSYPSVSIDSIVHVESPNYLLVYLNIKNAKPGFVPIKFNYKRDKKIINFELKSREMAGDKRMGFSNVDVLYMLMPDRFANGSTKNDQIKGMNHYVCNRNEPSLRHGGDLEGIRQHLDYFKELGVTALWLTPVLENNSPDDNGFSTYHGYATTNYYKVDPRFGSNQEYKRLVKEAHQKGLKVVMDMIFNHCGFEHPWIKDMPAKNWFNKPEWLDEGKNTKNTGMDRNTGMGTGNKHSKYLQTSYKLTPVLDPYSSKIDLKETVDGWFVPSMPDLNQKNTHVITYLIQNSIWWIETIGIDGIRMDTYPYADKTAMAKWMKTLDEEYPNFNVVGETWVTQPPYTAAWQKNSKLSKENSYLKSVMDFSFFDKLNKAKHEETDNWWNGYNRIYNSLVYDYLYTNPSSVMAFIENHDTDRFLAHTQDTKMLKQALALLLTINRTPQLYYGTEILMNGTKEITDGNVRKDFPGGFPGDINNCFTPKGRTKAQNEMFSWLSKILHWRQANDIIIHGKQTQFIPYKGVYVIARSFKAKHVLTILNGTSKPATCFVNRYAEIIENHNNARCIITGKNIDLTKNINLAPRETLIIEF